MNHSPHHQNTVWVLEDEDNCRLLYEEILKEQYHVQSFCSLNELRTALSDSNAPAPRMLIADLRLPDGVFLDLAREREGKFPSPFIVVSVIHDANILRECYQFGARDILTKPFVGAELLVKIERILAAETTSRSLTLCSKKKTATHRGTTVDLTQREFQILRSFDRAPSRQINRTSIIHSIWGSEKISPKNFDVHLVHLRRKLKELGIEIKMVEPGVYRLSETP